MRFRLALKMEMAALHNLRANLRYYDKHIDSGLDAEIKQISSYIVELNQKKTIEDLLLIEGRCRQFYYQCFNKIIKQEAFHFETRSRRPPCDSINAMISFGNTLLYNRFQQILWKTSLDSRIGIVHSANKRQYSLNLDFADIFKPIIVDRVIFTLINRKQMNTARDFVVNENGSVYMNEIGKRVFLEQFEEKMNSKITARKKTLTYQQLMEQEIQQFQKHITEDVPYKPYKYTS